MPDVHPSEDKAALYLLDGLTATERREFETELAQSAELRALVRELEESAVLLARSSPQRRPPAKIWQAIEKTVVTEPRPTPVVPAFWMAWSGWAAAAAFLLGWLLYAFWVNRLDTPHISKSTSAFTLSQVETLPGNNPDSHNLSIPRSTNKLDETTRLTSDAQELIRLRRQVTDLQNRVSNLSQSVTQQQALLGESNRIKFIQLASTSSNAGTAPAPSLSPALQRAIFLAMARELGWLPAADASASGGNVVSNPGNVDFLDLRTATNAVANAPQDQSNNQPPSHAAPENSPISNAAPIAIPAFTSGNNVVVAIDQSIVPTGTQLNFLNQDQQPIGTTTLGDNPMVITIPTSINGGTIFVTTGNMASPINIFQYFNPGTAIP